MTITGNNFYKIASGFFLTGYSWLIYNTITAGHVHGVCIFKWLTHLPCPSCGTTRAVELIMQGDIPGSVLVNPFGLLCFTAMLIFPGWLFYDWRYGKQTMLVWYGKMEHMVQRKSCYGILFILVVLNWFWNIYKGI